MRVVSWNINSLRRRLTRFLSWLETTRPDVVCLQETKCTDEQFPVLELKAAGYNAAFHGQKSYNGVAIIACHELTDVRPSLCDEVEDPQARVLAATINGRRFFSIYAPNGQAPGTAAYSYKMEWFGRLQRCLRLSGATELVICGDFNVAPEDRDVHDPQLWEGAIMCTEAERAALRGLLDLGLADTLRLHRPETGLFSWWDYRMLAFPKNRGLRIDLILASAPIAKCCRDAGIDREMRKGKEPSDHAPVWADFT